MSAGKTKKKKTWIGSRLVACPKGYMILPMEALYQKREPCSVM